LIYYGDQEQLEQISNRFVSGEEGNSFPNKRQGFVQLDIFLEKDPNKGFGALRFAYGDFDPEKDKLVEETREKTGLAYDNSTWMARTGTHEGLGHGILGVDHSDTKYSRSSSRRGVAKIYWSLDLKKQDIMRSGNGTRLSPFPFETGDTDILKFETSHLKEIKKVIKDDVKPQDNYCKNACN
jgi:hypothetical protein